MKKKLFPLHLLPVILLLSLICFPDNLLFAQNGDTSTAVIDDRDTNRIVKTNWTNSMGHVGSESCILLEEDNILLFVMKARFANPDISEIPPLHFWYNYWIPYPTGAIPFFELTEQLTDVHSAGFINGGPIWEVRYTVEIDLTEMCSFALEPFFMEMTYQLVTKSSPASAHMPYPYAPYPDAFPPGMFDIPPGGLSVEWSKEKRICCFGCVGCLTAPSQNDGFVPDQEGSNVASAMNKTEASPNDKRKGSLENLLVSPNPFGSKLNINYSLKEKGSFLFSCTNSVGEVLILENISQVAAGDYKLTVDTDQFPPGIYFLRFSNTDMEDVVKVIKLGN